jgi:cytochrome oxidase Cu insertion factor (SCO1/SenC/PrrC family)
MVFGIRFSVLFGVVLASAAINAAAAELAPPAGLTAPAKPTRLPAFNLSTTAGGAVASDDLRGKVVIARFWATW